MSRGGAVLLAGSLLAAGPALAKKPLAPGERVDVNHATAAELMRLPGVGRARAEAIVALRARRPFQRLEDLAAARGISRAWVQRHRDCLALTPAAAPPAPAPLPARGRGAAPPAAAEAAHAP